MTRRDFLAAAAASLAVAADAEPRSRMGIASTSWMTFRRYRDTYEFLEHCNSLGAAGIQAAINGDPARIRARAEELGMYVEAIVRMPNPGEPSPFEHAVDDAKAAGALCVRVNAGGRRYEDFSTLADYNAFVERSKASLREAVAICERRRIPFALENHKDWTLDQMVPLLRSYSSEYLGACLDFGNNISLLDDPMDVAEQLAPFAITTHVKDMGVEPYADGFLLSEVRLGDGFLDLRAHVLSGPPGAPKDELQPGDDHARSPEGPLPYRSLLGDFSRPQRPSSGSNAAAGPRACEAAAARRSTPARRTTPGGRGKRARQHAIREPEAPVE